MHFFDRWLSESRRIVSGMLHARASWLWVAAVLAVELIAEISGGTAALSWWFENFGLSQRSFLDGKIWQLFTYGLMHGGWWHLVLNALIVVLVGSRVEHVTGPQVMVKCTVAGILGGGLGHLLLGTGLLVGLSGGCFALLLLLTTLSPQSRMLPLPLSGRSLGAGLVLAALLLALINPELGLPGLAVAGHALVEHGMGSWFQMGHACHFGGGLAGWVYARWILRPPITLARLQRDRQLRERR
jgi:membrane associated rhomboid family serine protease